MRCTGERRRAFVGPNSVRPDVGPRANAKDACVYAPNWELRGTRCLSADAEGREGGQGCVKKLAFKQDHVAQRVRGAEWTNKINQLSTSNPCATASLREIVDFFERASRNPFHSPDTEQEDETLHGLLVRGNGGYRFLSGISSTCAERPLTRRPCRRPLPSERWLFLYGRGRTA